MWPPLYMRIDKDRDTLFLASIMVYIWSNRWPRLHALVHTLTPCQGRATGYLLCSVYPQQPRPPCLISAHYYYVRGGLRAIYYKYPKYGHSHAFPLPDVPLNIGTMSGAGYGLFTMYPQRIASTTPSLPDLCSLLLCQGRGTGYLL